MRVLLVGLVAMAAACSDGVVPASHQAADAATTVPLQADAASAAARDATTTEAEAGSRGDLCGAAAQRSGYVEYTLPLPDLCQMLANDGRVECPANRRSAVESRVDCGSKRSFPVLYRRCSRDELFEPHPSLYYLAWIFDADTGALIAARVGGNGLACGPGTYLAGPQDFVVCDGANVDCRLCEGGPERDAQCPADVVAALPGQACETPSVAPGCACQTDAGTFKDLPLQGAACGAPTTCPSCQSGTCWATCVCALDGVFRWDVQCTE
jgi:hypothetical protein